MNDVPGSPQKQEERRTFNDFSDGPLFRKRADKPGHGTNRAHYRSTYASTNPSMMRMDSSADEDKSSMQMWDSFLSGGQTLRFQEEKKKNAKTEQRASVEKEKHPLLSILQDAGVVNSIFEDSEESAFLQENSKAKRPRGLRRTSASSFGQFRRGGGGNDMRFSDSRRGGQQQQQQQPSYSSFSSPRMTNYNMFQDNQQQQQQQGEQLNIDSVQPDAFTQAGPSGGNPFGGNMPPPAAPNYEYSQVNVGGGHPAPPPPPPPLPAMQRGKSPRPTSPSSPPTMNGGGGGGNSNLPPMSMGPFSPGTQKSSTKMPEMPSGIDVHFLPRFKETSTSIIHGAAAFKNGMHPTPPLPRAPSSV